MHSNHFILPLEKQSFKTDSNESSEFYNTENRSPNSNQVGQTNSQFIWNEVYHVLKDSDNLKRVFVNNLHHLFISKQRFDQIKNKDPIFESLVSKYQSRNCLKAISILVDLSHIKINQYKFLYEGFTIGTAVKLLLKESVYLYKSLLKREDPLKECKRLVTNWIKCLIIIHRVPEDAQIQFIKVILESTELYINDRIREEEITRIV